MAMREARAAMERAVNWIKQSYPELARLAREHLHSLELYGSRDSRFRPIGVYGFFDPRSGRPHIGVEAERCGADAGRYVEVLVHELTHLRQWVEGRAATESECERAGAEAARRYRADARPEKGPRPVASRHPAYDPDLVVYRQNAEAGRRAWALYRLEQKSEVRQ